MDIPQTFEYIATLCDKAIDSDDYKEQKNAILQINVLIRRVLDDEKATYIDREKCAVVLECVNRALGKDP
jgi:hypothetical protein